MYDSVIALNACGFGCHPAEQRYGGCEGFDPVFVTHASRDERV